MRNAKIFSFILLLMIASQAGAAQIKDIELDGHKYYDNIFVITSDYIKPNVMLLDSPPRLVLDFKDVQISDIKNYTKIKSERIKGIRMSQFSTKPMIVRVVIDLNKMVDYESATIYGTNKTVLEIRNTSRPYIYKAAKQPSKSKVVQPKPSGLPVTLKEKKVQPQIVEVKKVLPKKIVKAAKKKPAVKKAKAYKRPSILRGKVIVVDPGHGGKDPGAFGLYGLVEKELTLKTAYRLVEFLKKAGAKVYLTRKRNVKIDLKEVVAFTNRIKADAYIGIHYNAAYNSRTNGMETYYYHKSSNRLAQIVHRNLRKKIRRPDREVRRAMLYTVHHAGMPAIIVEPAYLTNPVDARLLQSSTFLKSVAWGITAGLKEYFR